MAIYCDKCGARHECSVCPVCHGLGKPDTAVTDELRAKFENYKTGMRLRGYILSELDWIVYQDAHKAGLASRDAEVKALKRDAEPVAYLVIQKNRLSHGALYRSREEALEDGLADWEIDEVIPVYADPPAAHVSVSDGFALVPIPPANCRQRLMRAGKPYPRSSCQACGKWAPNAGDCDAQLAASVIDAVPEVSDHAPKRGEG